MTIKLAYPIVTLPALLAAPNQASFAILPRESEGQYDLRRTVIGSGPFYLSDYSPSTRLQFKRNPGYYDRERPYVDGLDYPIIPEYATALAALRAGQLYAYPVRQMDVVALKRDVPHIQMYQTDVMANASGAFFGYKPTDKSPFRDERVRQAFSMSLDRDAYIEVIFNVSAFESQGLPVETRWHSSFAANEFEGWWLDPKAKAFGPNSVYFQMNLPDARKLLAAAGHPSGVEVTSNNASSGYGPDYPKHIEIVEEMARQAGFRFIKNIVDYNTAWQPNFRDAQGNFEGVAYKPFLAPSTDPLERMSGQYFSSAGSTFFGFDADGKGTFTGDPFIDDLVIKNRMELDLEKRKAAVLEMQRYLAKRQYAVRYPGTASGFNVAWPVLKNWNVFRGDPRDYFYEWLDGSARPLSVS